MDFWHDIHMLRIRCNFLHDELLVNSCTDSEAWLAE